MPRDFHNRPDWGSENAFSAIKKDAAQIVEFLTGRGSLPLKLEADSFQANRYSFDLALRIISMVKDLPDRDFEITIIASNGEKRNTFTTKETRRGFSRILSFLGKARREITLHIEKRSSTRSYETDSYELRLG